MQAVIDFINKHLYDCFIPLTALGVLRIGMCLAQLKKTRQIREKKGVYHAVGQNYTAREAASHTLESGAAKIEETTEDKGDTENG